MASFLQLFPSSVLLLSLSYLLGVFARSTCTHDARARINFMHDGDANAFRVRGSVVFVQNDGLVISKLIWIFSFLSYFFFFFFFFFRASVRYLKS